MQGVHTLIYRHEFRVVPAKKTGDTITDTPPFHSSIKIINVILLSGSFVHRLSKGFEMNGMIPRIFIRKHCKSRSDTVRFRSLSIGKIIEGIKQASWD